MMALATLLLMGGTVFSEPPAKKQDIAGTWAVDLRLDLKDAPYSQPMVLMVADDGTVSGRFYDTDIKAGRVGGGQGRTCVAFRTADGSGFYHSSACLTGGRMVGQTWSEGRGFVLPWTAERR